MRSTTTIAALAGAATVAQAGVIRSRSNPAAPSFASNSSSSSGGVAVYWGIEDNERSLAEYCQDGEGIDILILDFLSSFGDGTYPNTGQSGIGGCFVDSSGNLSGDCSDVGNDITTCQQAGKKIFVSIGGAAAQFQIDNDGDADGIAYSLWNSYANPSVTDNSSARPFGDAVIDGWDFDIEADPNSSDQYFGELINKLRGYFSTDSSRSYYISGAPQCPFQSDGTPYYMGESINDAQYDYLWIQFYNNDCSVGNLVNDPSTNPDGQGSFNLADWPSHLSGGKSANAQLFVGMPASTNAAASFDFVPASDLGKVVSASTSVPGFAGFMLWDAGSSDSTNDNGCTYAQNLASALSTGSPC